jgi:hypothetical protein
MPTQSSDPVVYPIAQRDAVTLIGILAIIEGLLLAEQLDAATEGKIARRSGRICSGRRGRVRTLPASSTT